MDDKDYKKFNKLKIHFTADKVMPGHNETFEYGFDRKQDGHLYISIRGNVVMVNLDCVWKVETWRE